MRFVFLISLLLIPLMEVWAQDQLKLQDSHQILEGKILSVNWSGIIFRTQEGRGKRIELELVDSIYTQNEEIWQSILKWKASRNKLKIQPFEGKINPVEKAEVLPDPVQAKKSLTKIAHANPIDPDKYNTRLLGAGNALNTAGTCLLLGGCSTLVGGIVMANGSTDVGLVLVAAGGVFNIVGVGNLIRSGNFLRGTRGKSLDIGIDGRGIGIYYGF